MATRRDILLDVTTGERVLVGANYLFAEGGAAVKQGIAARVRLFLGEYWLDEGRGVDYFGKILIARPQPMVVEAELSRAIADTPDVTAVKAVSYDKQTNANGRRATVAYACTSTAGPVTGSVTP